jgi:chemotaxis response regulator CheB
MGNRDIVAIGTSAGGVPALLFLAKNLQRDLPASRRMDRLAAQADLERKRAAE